MHHHRRPGSFQCGNAMTLSLEAKDMLRAVRGEVDASGIYRGSNAAAAALAGVTEDAAARALHELGSRGMLTLARVTRPRRT